jgi:hemerythrin-like domain-containing protein
MVNLIEILKEEHRQLLTHIVVLERFLAELADAASGAPVERFRALLQQIIELLAVHGEREKTELFPALRVRLPEADRWQVSRIEVQDEAIMKEARTLHERSAGAFLSTSLRQFKEAGAHLIRQVREHVTIEEEHIFPKFQSVSAAPPLQQTSTAPGTTWWGYLKTLGRRFRA